MNVSYIGKHLKMFHVHYHSHVYSELVYCTGGCGTFQTGDESLAYREGEAVIVPAGLPHRNDSSEGFSNIYATVFDIAVPLNGRMMLIRDSENRDLMLTLNQLHHYFSQNNGAFGAIVASLTRLAEAYLSLFAGMSRYSPSVERIMEIIISRFGDSGFSAADALREIPLCPAYARKLFKKEKGVSPCRFLLDMRLDHARHMLAARRQYGLSVSQIAGACGFSDPLYFSRVFHKHAGSTPVQYSRVHAADSPCVYHSGSKLLGPLS